MLSWIDEMVIKIADRNCFDSISFELSNFARSYLQKNFFSKNVYKSFEAQNF